MLFATVSFATPKLRAYDLQLDHWEICRKDDEIFEEMCACFALDSGPVARWYRSNRNGFYDNSIKGVNELHRKADPTSPSIYHFSFSFNATTSFPTQLPPWAFASFEAFPLPFVSKIQAIAPYFPPLNLGIWLFNRYLRTPLYALLWKYLSQTISIPSVVGWVTKDVTQTFLTTQLGFSVALPQPGSYLPRSDVIPPMLPFCYGMSGQALSTEQKNILLGLVAGNDADKDLGDWCRNDAIVNTASMSGPCDACVAEIKGFPMQQLKGEVNGVSENGEESVDARGVWWHFGVNNRMDHADEIGVFIDDDTVRRSFSSTCFLPFATP
jgi:hypothetical protein